MAFRSLINQANPRKRPLVEEHKPTTVMCTVVAVDHTNFCYRVCSVCETTLPEPLAGDPSSPSLPVCRYCTLRNAFNPASSGSKRLFRVLMSIATDTRAFVVVMFDRAARVLFGCSADEFYDFTKIHSSAAVTASKVLEGEMLRVTLSKPKSGNAQHLRVVSVVPLSSRFQTAIVSLRELYQVRGLNLRCVFLFHIFVYYHVCIRHHLLHCKQLHEFLDLFFVLALTYLFLRCRRRTKLNFSYT